MFCYYPALEDIIKQIQKTHSLWACGHQPRSEWHPAFSSLETGGTLSALWPAPLAQPSSNKLRALQCQNTTYLGKDSVILFGQCLGQSPWRFATSYESVLNTSYKTYKNINTKTAKCSWGIACCFWWFLLSPPAAAMAMPECQPRMEAWSELGAAPAQLSDPTKSNFSGKADE